jgi:hypothetical protein
VSAPIPYGDAPGEVFTPEQAERFMRIMYAQARHYFAWAAGYALAGVDASKPRKPRRAPDLAGEDARGLRSVVGGGR